MTATPHVSVLMSVHNGCRYVEEAVDSILNQSMADFEFIIVDDGSTDGVSEILEQYVQRDDRIRLVTQDNAGLTRSLNLALSRARGELIARMDADDISHPHRILTQVDFLRAHPEVVCVGAQVRLIDEDGDLVGLWPRPLHHHEIQQRLMQGEGGLIIHPVSMMRRSALEQVGLYDERFKRGQDFALWMRLAEIGYLANLGEVLLDWRHHGESAGYTASAEQYQVVKTVLLEAYQRRGIPAWNLPNPPSFVRTSKADRHVSLATMAGSQGHSAAALKHARRALPYLRFGSDIWLEMHALAISYGLRGMVNLKQFQRISLGITRVIRAALTSR